MDGNGSIPGGEGQTFGANSSFKFDCHRGLPCFGQCCRDINIFLTPYDVARLRKKLGISSAEFLKKYTGELDLPGIKFPFLYLKMSEEDQLKCPFVTEGGCAVYQERPWSCRMAPVDVAGPDSFRFAFGRDKCLGLNEDREWTVREWMEIQDMYRYDEVESLFREIPFLISFTGQAALDRRIIQLFRMACYDIDTFRDFILRHKFLIKEGGLDADSFIRPVGDDQDLIKAGIKWLINVCSDTKALKKIDKLL